MAESKADASEEDRDVIDLNKRPVLGCILIPILTAILLLTVLFALGGGAFLFALVSELFTFCVPAEAASVLRSAAAQYAPAFFGAVIVAALIASFLRPAGLWFRIVMIPLWAGVLLLAAFLALQRMGLCPGLEAAAG